MGFKLLFFVVQRISAVVVQFGVKTGRISNKFEMSYGLQRKVSCGLFLPHYQLEKCGSVGKTENMPGVRNSVIYSLER